MIDTIAAPTAKAALRAAALGRRDAIGPASRETASAAIAERAVASSPKRGPAVLAAYRAIRTEVDPAAIVDWALGAGHRGRAPGRSAIPPTLVFRHYQPGVPLAPAGFGTLAPDRQTAEVDPDVVVVPLAGFDRVGHRLGYGRGYYDRGLANAARARPQAADDRPCIRGQEVDAIPAEPHDVRLDWVVTENGAHRLPISFE